MQGYQIGAVLSVLGRYSYHRWRVQECLQDSGVRVHKWVDALDGEEVRIGKHFD